ncbi:pilus assembly protein PilM [Halodesulfovibrio aestuarii]|uniref:Tfp pilus assembly protein, ATPase PilM n=2 Tax=Halodesulfovibrio aestuarii TaxID=126333 RepID=A0A8G2CA81_9BACT|nr:pilus assembly protein PilM [Halodesulfovibrio aestuarii]SHJ27389.1 Tfp pilus assembly protein, ATPase PilM [Halodesulfovibrio aestuarii]
MSTKILCIACSEERMAFCQFAVSWRGAQLLEHHIAPISDFSDPLTLAKELAAVLDRYELRSDQYRLSLPTQVTILRNWTFPFSSAKQISQALEFELEQEIPFTSEETVTGIQFGAKTRQGRKVTSATMHKEFLSSLVKALQTHDIDPQLITVNSFALAQAASAISSNAPTLLLNIDAENSELVCIENNIPCTVSQIPYGILNIKKALEQQLNATQDSIDRFIYFSDIATVDNSSKPEEADFKEALITQLQRLAKQILASANCNTPNAESMLLCGDLAQLQGVEKLFADEMGIPTTAIHKHPKASTLLPIKDNTEWLECLPAIALAPVKNPAFTPTKLLNFRKDEFYFLKQRDLLTQVTTYATAITCILMLGWSISLFAQGHKNAQHAAALNTELKNTLQKTLPDIRGSFGAIQYTSILKSRLSQLRGTTISNDTDTKKDSLDLLLALHTSTPKALDIDVEAIRITEKNMGLVGTTDSYNTLEKLRSQLAKNRYFNAVSIRGATNQKKQKRIRFELEMERAG